MDLGRARGLLWIRHVTRDLYPSADFNIYNKNNFSREALGYRVLAGRVETSKPR